MNFLRSSIAIDPRTPRTGALLAALALCGLTACGEPTDHLAHEAPGPDVQDGTSAGAADTATTRQDSATRSAGDADRVSMPEGLPPEDIEAFLAFEERGGCALEHDHDHVHGPCAGDDCALEHKNSCPSANWGWRPAMPYPSGTPVIITRSWGCAGGHTPGSWSQYGVDSVGSGSKDILAVADGTVRYVHRDCPSVWTNCSNASVWPHSCPGSPHTGFGNSVVIEHAGGRFSRYAHLEPGSIPAYIQPGARVCTGLVIGREGGSGCTWGSRGEGTVGNGQHLHYQMQDSVTGRSIVFPGWQGMNIIPQNSGTFTSTTTRRTSCPAPCTHACSAGARRCAGDGRYESCADHNGNGCRSWGGAINCPGGQVCRGAGTCCAETCTGGRQCVSDHEFESCADHNGNGCRTFGARQSCGEGRGCRGEGECFDLWQAAPGKACAEDADCGWDRVCRFRTAGGFCTTGCGNDADCPDGSLCAIRGTATFCAPDAAPLGDTEGDTDEEGETENDTAEAGGEGDGEHGQGGGVDQEETGTAPDATRCRPGLVVDTDDADRWHCAPDCRQDPGICGAGAWCGDEGTCAACRCDAGTCGVLACGVDCGRCPEGERCGSDHRCVRPTERTPEPDQDGGEAGDGGQQPGDAPDDNAADVGEDTTDSGTAGDGAGSDDASRPAARREGGGVTRTGDDDAGHAGASGTGCAIANGPSGGGVEWGAWVLLLGLMRRRGVRGVDGGGGDDDSARAGRS